MVLKNKSNWSNRKSIDGLSNNSRNLLYIKFEIRELVTGSADASKQTAARQLLIFLGTKKQTAAQLFETYCF